MKNEIRVLSKFTKTEIRQKVCVEIKKNEDDKDSKNNFVGKKKEEKERNRLQLQK